MFGSNSYIKKTVKGRLQETKRKRNGVITTVFRYIDCFISQSFSSAGIKGESHVSLAWTGNALRNYSKPCF